MKSLVDNLAILQEVWFSNTYFEYFNVNRFPSKTNVFIVMLQIFYLFIKKYDIIILKVIFAFI